MDLCLGIGGFYVFWQVSVLQWAAQASSGLHSHQAGMNDESDNEESGNEALRAIPGHGRQLEQLKRNAAWLREQIDIIHDNLCPGRLGTWQDRVIQAVTASRQPRLDLDQVVEWLRRGKPITVKGQGTWYMTHHSSHHLLMDEKGARVEKVLALCSEPDGPTNAKMKEIEIRLFKQEDCSIDLL